MTNKNTNPAHQFTELSADNAVYLESLYEDFLTDPSSVDEKYLPYFAQFAKDDNKNLLHHAIQGQFLQLARNTTSAKVGSTKVVAPSNIQTLINAYREYGHRKAELDPLKLIKRPDVAELSLAYHGFSEADLDKKFPVGDLNIGKSEATLREIVEILQRVYSSHIASEFVHVATSEERQWIQNYLEKNLGVIKFDNEKRKEIFERLNAAEGLEKYLARKYTGVKRFGLEGGESFIPMVHEIVQRAGSAGTKEVVIGMAHRGRLNLLVNILGKNPQVLFDEFDGKIQPTIGSGDVKYHNGFSSNVMTAGGETHLSLAYNPSHLEIVSPVVIGSVRARQVRHNDSVGDSALPIVVHGDAAFAGQGVNQETFQMSQTRAYKTGGTVHIVINNQVGFTTSRPEDARSTEYCTDIAKMVHAPIFHVNGDDPEAVVFVAQLIHDYRKTFHKDVVADLFCYRRNGHNESDEPAVTQPVMYSVIRKLPTTRQFYAEKLIAEGVFSKADADAYEENYRLALENGKDVAVGLVAEPNKDLFVDWTPYLNQPLIDDVDTSVDIEKLKEYARRMAIVPESFELQRQVQKTVEQRLSMQSGQEPLNWGAGETLAYASLVDEGNAVRITGEDVGRGTFSHRHSELYNVKDNDFYVPLQHISDNQAPFHTFNSLLSEEAVLAFEYGYSTTLPKTLTIWEAQFGDFANGAQVVIDQFIASGETKWQRFSGLTMLLPHGYEGQGPEHSSARLERFLQLCAEDNMQVVTPTTPAQIFHLLRRQAVRLVRKPLVVMSPKSLLRHPLATSTLEELANGKFETVLPEIDTLDNSKVTRVVLCGGKVYYDLLAKRRELGLENVALVRIEQLYPLPEERILAEIAKYPNATDIVWTQEEPLNQGAWHYLIPDFYRLFGEKASVVARPAAAAPAAGTGKIHNAQQQAVVNGALGIA